MKFKKQIGIIIGCIAILGVVFFAVSSIGDKNKTASNNDSENKVVENTSNVNEEKDNAANNTNEKDKVAEGETESGLTAGIKEGYYDVKENDTLYSIAKTYMPNSNPETVVEAIIERNNLSSNVISKGQKLIISYEVALEKKENTENNASANATGHENHIEYVVKEGDTLYSIAEQYMASMNVMEAIEKIKQDNNMGESSVIKVSDTICIPAIEQ